MNIILLMLSKRENYINYKCILKEILFFIMYFRCYRTKYYLEKVILIKK